MPTSTDPQHVVPGAGRRARGQHASHAHGTAFRLLRGFLVTAVVLAVVAAGGGVFAYHRLQGNINAQDIADRLGVRPDDESTADPTTGQDAVNILVMGSDTRALSDGTGGEYGGESADPGARSDTTVLVHLAADRQSATLVSIPRDSMVQIPDCTAEDGTTKPAHKGQFNSAFSEGGAACTLRTVEAVTGIFIDHYVVVDFSGFRSMVDALGGVTICTPEPIDDTRANLHLPAGTQTVDGETALAYARVRYIGDGSDISRIGRQQALMSSMVQQVTSSGILLRPDRLYSFLDAATKSVTTDTGLASLTEIASLAQSLQKMPADGVRFVTVPTEEYPADRNRVQFTAAAETLWQQIRTDTAGPAATPSPSASSDPAASSQLLVAPSAVQVQVLNVGAPAGTAATVADQLAGVGFVEAGTGDGEATEPGAGVLVRHGTGQADSANTVAAALGGARTRLDASLGRTVVVEVASAAVTVTDVRSRVTGTPAAAPSPSASIPARVATDDICA
ncbi:LCP family protein required for cell wall assembly [Kineococcus radiotolerans]|uniref:Cell envelope-related transcriptional attenuator n=2 Tax=Kineococcus radiotolerans TaxID=131568 RepID=A6W3Y3_KINRD|nr:LCP family protein [Kineococcus radiotolerans]ABS01522.1 cell envelope-related transcriptional attenuator [Kineococcus radiotolerans SRS30216 = ATCC BAA-149]MBB2901347.1 LCP family protein required for cell wall assembly [Kineococcus radiotolerans]